MMHNWLHIFIKIVANISQGKTRKTWQRKFGPVIGRRR